MWTKELFGTDIYHLVTAFVIYSILGWLVESIYMSFCNKKITNRGFAKGPFCPIYGFGAVIGKPGFDTTSSPQTGTVFCGSH